MINAPLSQQRSKPGALGLIALTVAALMEIGAAYAASVSDGQAKWNSTCSGSNCHQGNPGEASSRHRGAANNESAITNAINDAIADANNPNLTPGQRRNAGMENLVLNDTEKLNLARYIGQYVAPEMNNGSIELSSCAGGSIDVHTQAKTGKGGAPDSGGVVVVSPASRGEATVSTASGHVINYTPGANFNGAGDSFTYNVTNTADTTATPATVTVVVRVASPSVTLSNRSGAVNQAFGPVTVTTNTLPIRGVANRDPMPPGLRLESNQILGTPTQSGIFHVRLTATNCIGEGPERTVTFTIAPNALPIISSTSFEGTLGQSFLASIEATNPPISTYSAINLPPGLQVNASTGKITGAPTQSGVFDTVTLTATNSVGTSPPQLATITIFPKDKPTISLEPSPLIGTWNQRFNGRISATNPPIERYEGVELPPGLTVNPATGEISGIPTEPGVFKPKFIARNKAGSTETNPDFSIIAPPPSAQGISMSVKLNQATTLDLKPHLSGHGINGIALVGSPAQPKHGTVAINGTKVTYSPRRDYFGHDSFSFVALGTGGTSSPAIVNVTVEGRPNPSEDANVVGLTNAQSDAARRFSRAQISNVQGRLETLHRRSLGTAASDVEEQARDPEKTFGGRTVVDPFQRATRNGSTMGSAQSDADRDTIIPFAGKVVESLLPEAVSGVLPGGLFGTLLGASQGGTLNLTRFAAGDTRAQETGLWAAGNIGFGDRDSSADRSSFKFRTSGVSLGVDQRFSDKLVLGVGLGYARDRTSVGSDGTQSRARATSLSVYGSYQPSSKNIFVDGLLGYGVLDYGTNRFVDALTEVNLPEGVEPTKHFARASRDGSQIFGSIAAGYESPRESGFLWSPYARLDVSRNQLDKTTETGAGQYALTYSKQSIANADLSLGLRAQWEHELRRGGVALPQIRLEYTRNLKSDGRASLAYADLIDGPRYSVPAVGDDRDALTLGVGSDFVLCNGTNFGINYQFRHSSGAENSQGLQFRLAKELGVAQRSCEPSDGGAPPNRRITADAAFTYDDNVTRARDNAGKLADESFSLKATKELEPIKLGRFGVVVSGSLGGEAFRRFSDLGHVFGEVQGELRYPAYGPKVALFARGAVDHYKSQIRRGQTYSAGIVLQRNFTQRGIGLTAQLAHNQRYGESGVFDLKDTSAQVGISYTLNKDLSTGKTDVLYLAGEYRLGDVVSTEKESLANLNIADVFVRDDAFDRNDLFSYRFDARTTAATIGYIKPLGSGHLDLSWTYAQSSPTERSFPGAGSERYIDNQFKLVYVLHFGTWNRMSRFRAY